MFSHLWFFHSKLVFSEVPAFPQSGLSYRSSNVMYRILIYVLESDFAIMDEHSESGKVGYTWDCLLADKGKPS